MVTLEGRNRYIVHHSALREYKDNGMVIVGVHRVVRFKEDRWLAPYVSHNARMRQQARNEFEKGFWKLLNNSIFGKAMENVRLYKEAKFAANAKQLKYQVRKWSYDCTITLEPSEPLAIVRHRKTAVTLDKPIYLGVAIMDLSKTIMYKFHFGEMKPLFKDRLRLLFTDTDSLAYEVTMKPQGEEKNAYELLLEVAAKVLDGSSFPEWHAVYQAACQNAKRPGFSRMSCAVGAFGVL